MKTTRKVLSFIIALAFILSAFPMPVAFAEGEEYEEINVNDGNTFIQIQPQGQTLTIE